ncbi:MAG: prepilin-type N-terminal cleavage/methylation domain-containing protein [Candidatus Sulfotelmatobacter sp.]
MKTRSAKSQNGFSLLELMIASFVGLILIAAMARLFRLGMNTTFTVIQRAETQQNMRAAIELMTKDISMAGAGLPSGGLQMASGSVTLVGCNQTGTCYVPGDVYPNSGTGVKNYMYGILPGYSNGVESGATISAAPAAVNDSITSIYCDYNFPLTNFTFTFPSTTQADVAVVNSAVQPNNILAAGGLNVGDLLLFQVSTPGNGTGDQGTSAAQTAAVVAEITGLPAGGGSITFAPGDPLNFNQTGANSLAYTISNLGSALGAGNTVSVCRLYAVTYFLQVPPTGGTVQTPRLMRQVNGLNAVPVADNIINLQFSYDVISSTSGLMNANQSNPVAAGDSPALIQKVNIWIMGQGLTSGNNKSQSMYLASSVSARNMSFCNSYSDSATVCN